MSEKKLYTINEVAEILQVTRRTIYNYIKAGELPAVKLGREWRVAAEELDAFTKNGTSNKYPAYVRTYIKKTDKPTT